MEPAGARRAGRPRLAARTAPPDHEDAKEERTCGSQRVSSWPSACVFILQVVLIVGLLASPGFREWAGMRARRLLGLCLAVVGLVLAIPRPQAGFLVGIAGNRIAFLVMPWLLPFFLPLPIVLGYRLARAPVAGQTPATGS